MPNALVNAVQALLSEKQRLASQERELIGALNGALAGIGYEVTARSAPSERPRGARKTAVRGRRKALACPHCDRRFAQPVHLGRHVSATHKVDQKVVALKVVKPRASRRTAKRQAVAKPAKVAVATVKKVVKKVKASAKKGAPKPAATKPSNAGTEAPTK